MTYTTNMIYQNSKQASIKQWNTEDTEQDRHDTTGTTIIYIILKLQINAKQRNKICAWTLENSIFTCRWQLYT